MIKQSITLGDGLLTLTASLECGIPHVGLNGAFCHKYLISRILTHTDSEAGNGVFQGHVALFHADSQREFTYEQDLLSIESPRAYLKQIMVTVNAARKFYGLPRITWQYVEDKRKVYLGGLEVTSNREGQVMLNWPKGLTCLDRVALPGSSRLQYDGVYGTTDHVISTLTYINEQRVDAGLRPLTWEVV